jgi:serine hydrolase
MKMKPIILFIQGGGEGAYEADKNLARYLQSAFGKTHKIIFPKVPNESDPKYDIYKRTIEEEIENIRVPVFLVGHSLGACFLLKYLTEKKIDKNISGLFLISTPFWGKGGWQYEGFTLDSKLASMKTSNIPTYFYHSTNDRIVPYSHLDLYENKFPHAKIRRIIGRGHQLQNDLSEVVHDIEAVTTTMAKKQNV